MNEVVTTDLLTLSVVLGILEYSAATVDCKPDASQWMSVIDVVLPLRRPKIG